MSHQEPTRRIFWRCFSVLKQDRVTSPPSLCHALFLLLRSVSNHLIRPLQVEPFRAKTFSLSSFLFSVSLHYFCCWVALVTVNGGWFVSDTPCISTAERYRRRAGIQDGKIGRWKEKEGDYPGLRMTKEVERKTWKDADMMNAGWMNLSVCLSCITRTECSRHWCSLSHHPFLSPFCIYPPAAGGLSRPESPPKVSWLHI